MKSSARVLIVEDKRIPAEFLKETLEKHGFTVLGICDRGSTAIDEACRLLPDIILMDIILKDNITGSEAALKISSKIDTKIIFLTAHADNEMVEYALDAGAVNYLIKPYKEKQILTALRLALNIKNDESKQEKKTTINLEGDFHYKLTEQRLYHQKTEVNLGLKSAKLIRYLCENIDKTISNEELSLYVYDELKETSTIRALISRLNKTLNYNIIINSNGIGYKIVSV